MPVISNLFYVFLFIGIIGSIFSVAILFLQKVFRLNLPLWVGVLGAFFYLIPIVLPQVKLFSPEEQLWRYGYIVASKLWVMGAVFFLLYYLVRSIFAYRAVIKCETCTDEKILPIYKECVDKLHIKKVPKLVFGTLNEPACVVTIFIPVIILNEIIIRQLSEKELKIVLCHELTHIKRKHHMFQHIYDFIIILYWFIPFVWIERYEFAYSCEMDCDKTTLKTLDFEVTVKEYTTTMIHLMEFTTKKENATYGKMNLLGFLVAKQRFISIMQRPSQKSEIGKLIVVTIVIIFTIIVSIIVSRSMFYPYPAHNNGYQEYKITMEP